MTNYLLFRYSAFRKKRRKKVMSLLLFFSFPSFTFSIYIFSTYCTTRPVEAVVFGPRQLDREQNYNLNLDRDLDGETSTTSGKDVLDEATTYEVTADEHHDPQRTSTFPEHDAAIVEQNVDLLQDGQSVVVAPEKLSGGSIEDEEDDVLEKTSEQRPSRRSISTPSSAWSEVVAATSTTSEQSAAKRTKKFLQKKRQVIAKLERQEIFLFQLTPALGGGEELRAHDSSRKSDGGVASTRIISRFDYEIAMAGLRGNGLTLSDLTYSFVMNDLPVQEVQKDVELDLPQDRRAVFSEAEWLELAKTACAENGLALQYVFPLHLRSNRDLVRNYCLQQNGRALKYASAELRSDREIVQYAVQRAGTALAFASWHLRRDFDTVLRAVIQDERAAYAIALEEIGNEWSTFLYQTEFWYSDEEDEAHRFGMAQLQDSDPFPINEARQEKGAQFLRILLQFLREKTLQGLWQLENLGFLSTLPRGLPEDDEDPDSTSDREPLPDSKTTEDHTNKKKMNTAGGPAAPGVVTTTATQTTTHWNKRFRSTQSLKEQLDWLIERWSVSREDFYSPITAQEDEAEDAERDGPQPAPAGPGSSTSNPEKMKLKEVDVSGESSSTVLIPRMNGTTTSAAEQVDNLSTTLRRPRREKIVGRTNSNVSNRNHKYPLYDHEYWRMAVRSARDDRKDENSSHLLLPGQLHPVVDTHPFREYPISVITKEELLLLKIAFERHGWNRYFGDVEMSRGFGQKSTQAPAVTNLRNGMTQLHDFLQQDNYGKLRTSSTPPRGDESDAVRTRSTTTAGRTKNYPLLQLPDPRAHPDTGFFHPGGEFTALDHSGSIGKAVSMTATFRWNLAFLLKLKKRKSTTIGSSATTSTSSTRFAPSLTTSSAPTSSAEARTTTAQTTSVSATQPFLCGEFVYTPTYEALPSVVEPFYTKKLDPIFEFLQWEKLYGESSTTISGGLLSNSTSSTSVFPVARTNPADFEHVAAFFQAGPHGVIYCPGEVVPGGAEATSSTPAAAAEEAFYTPPAEGLLREKSDTTTSSLLQEEALSTRPEGGGFKNSSDQHLLEDETLQHVDPAAAPGVGLEQEREDGSFSSPEQDVHADHHDPFNLELYPYLFATGPRGLELFFLHSIALPSRPTVRNLPRMVKQFTLSQAMKGKYSRAELRASDVELNQREDAASGDPHFGQFMIRRGEQGEGMSPPTAATSYLQNRHRRELLLVQKSLLRQWSRSSAYYLQALLDQSKVDAMQDKIVDQYAAYPFYRSCRPQHGRPQLGGGGGGPPVTELLLWLDPGEAGLALGGDYSFHRGQMEKRYRERVGLGSEDHWINQPISAPANKDAPGPAWITDHEATINKPDHDPATREEVGDQSPMMSWYGAPIPHWASEALDKVQETHELFVLMLQGIYQTQFGSTLVLTTDQLEHIKQATVRLQLEAPPGAVGGEEGTTTSNAGRQPLLLDGTMTTAMSGFAAPPPRNSTTTTGVMSSTDTFNNPAPGLLQPEGLLEVEDDVAAAVGRLLVQDVLRAGMWRRKFADALLLSHPRLLMQLDNNLIQAEKNKMIGIKNPAAHASEGWDEMTRRNRRHDVHNPFLQHGMSVGGKFLLESKEQTADTSISGPHNAMGPDGERATEISLEMLHAHAGKEQELKSVKRKRLWRSWVLRLLQRQGSILRPVKGGEPAFFLWRKAEALFLPPIGNRFHNYPEKGAFIAAEDAENVVVVETKKHPRPLYGPVNSLPRGPAGPPLLPPSSSFLGGGNIQQADDAPDVVLEVTTPSRFLQLPPPPPEVAEDFGLLPRNGGQAGATASFLTVAVGTTKATPSSGAAAGAAASARPDEDTTTARVRDRAWLQKQNSRAAEGERKETSTSVADEVFSMVPEEDKKAAAAVTQAPAAREGAEEGAEQPENVDIGEEGGGQTKNYFGNDEEDEEESGRPLSRRHNSWLGGGNINSMGGFPVVGRDARFRSELPLQIAVRSSGASVGSAAFLLPVERDRELEDEADEQNSRPARPRDLGVRYPDMLAKEEEQLRELELFYHARYEIIHGEQHAVSLKSDYETAIAALRQDCTAYRYLSVPLMARQDLILLAARQGCDDIPHYLPLQQQLNFTMQFTNTVPRWLREDIGEQADLHLLSQSPQWSETILDSYFGPKFFAELAAVNANCLFSLLRVSRVDIRFSRLLSVLQKEESDRADVEQEAKEDHQHLDVDAGARTTSTTAKDGAPQESSSWGFLLQKEDARNGFHTRSSAVRQMVQKAVAGAGLLQFQAMLVRNYFHYKTEYLPGHAVKLRIEAGDFRQLEVAARGLEATSKTGSPASRMATRTTPASTSAQRFWQRRMELLQYLSIATGEDATARRRRDVAVDAHLWVAAEEGSADYTEARSERILEKGRYGSHPYTTSAPIQQEDLLLAQDGKTSRRRGPVFPFTIVLHRNDFYNFRYFNFDQQRGVHDGANSLRAAGERKIEGGRSRGFIQGDNTSMPPPPCNINKSNYFYEDGFLWDLKEQRIVPDPAATENETIKTDETSTSGTTNVDQGRTTASAAPSSRTEVDAAGPPCRDEGQESLPPEVDDRIISGGGPEPLFHRLKVTILEKDVPDVNLVRLLSKGDAEDQKIASGRFGHSYQERHQKWRGFFLNELCRQFRDLFFEKIDDGKNMGGINDGMKKNHKNQNDGTRQADEPEEEAGVEEVETTPDCRDFVDSFVFGERIVDDKKDVDLRMLNNGAAARTAESPLPRGPRDRSGKTRTSSPAAARAAPTSRGYPSSTSHRFLYYPRLSAFGKRTFEQTVLNQEGHSWWDAPNPRAPSLDLISNPFHGRRIRLPGDGIFSQFSLRNQDLFQGDTVPTGNSIFQPFWDYHTARLTTTAGAKNKNEPPADKQSSKTPARHSHLSVYQRIQLASNPVRHEKDLLIKLARKDPIGSVKLASFQLRNFDPEFQKAVLEKDGLALQYMEIAPLCAARPCSNVLFLPDYVAPGSSREQMEMKNSAGGTKSKAFSFIPRGAASGSDPLPGPSSPYQVVAQQLPRDLALLAVKSNGLALRYLSPELRADAEVVKMAVIQDAEALQFAHPSLRVYAPWEGAFSDAGIWPTELAAIPERGSSQEHPGGTSPVVAGRWKLSGKHPPNAKQIALKNSGFAVRYMGLDLGHDYDRFANPNWPSQFLQDDKKGKVPLPQQLLSNITHVSRVRELLENAVETDGEALRFVTAEMVKNRLLFPTLQDYFNLCKVAVEASGLALKHVHVHIRFPTVGRQLTKAGNSNINQAKKKRQAINAEQSRRKNAGGQEEQPGDAVGFDVVDTTTGTMLKNATQNTSAEVEVVGHNDQNANVDKKEQAPSEGASFLGTSSTEGDSAKNQIGRKNKSLCDKLEAAGAQHQNYWDLALRAVKQNGFAVEFVRRECLHKGTSSSVRTNNETDYLFAHLFQRVALVQAQNAEVVKKFYSTNLKDQSGFTKEVTEYLRTKMWLGSNELDHLYRGEKNKKNGILESLGGEDVRELPKQYPIWFPLLETERTLSDMLTLDRVARRVRKAIVPKEETKVIKFWYMDDKEQALAEKLENYSVELAFERRFQKPGGGSNGVRTVTTTDQHGRTTQTTYPETLPPAPVHASEMRGDQIIAGAGSTRWTSDGTRVADPLWTHNIQFLDYSEKRRRSGKKIPWFAKAQEGVDEEVDHVDDEIDSDSRGGAAPGPAQGPAGGAPVAGSGVAGPPGGAAPGGANAGLLGPSEDPNNKNSKIKPFLAGGGGNYNESGRELLTRPSAGQQQQQQQELELQQETWTLVVFASTLGVLGVIVLTVWLTGACGRLEREQQEWKRAKLRKQLLRKMKKLKAKKFAFGSEAQAPGFAQYQEGKRRRKGQQAKIRALSEPVDNNFLQPRSTVRGAGSGAGEYSKGSKKASAFTSTSSGVSPIKYHHFDALGAASSGGEDGFSSTSGGPGSASSSSQMTVASQRPSQVRRTVTRTSSAPGFLEQQQKSSATDTTPESGYESPRELRPSPQQIEQDQRLLRRGSSGRLGGSGNTGGASSAVPKKKKYLHNVQLNQQMVLTPGQHNLDEREHRSLSPPLELPDDVVIRPIGGGRKPKGMVTNNNVLVQRPQGIGGLALADRGGIFDIEEDADNLVIKPIGSQKEKTSALLSSSGSSAIGTAVLPTKITVGLKKGDVEGTTTGENNAINVSTSDEKKRLTSSPVTTMPQIPPMPSLSTLGPGSSSGLQESPSTKNSAGSSAASSAQDINSQEKKREVILIPELSGDGSTSYPSTADSAAQKQQKASKSPPGTTNNAASPPATSSPPATASLDKPNTDDPGRASSVVLPSSQQDKDNAVLMPNDDNKSGKAAEQVEPAEAQNLNIFKKLNAPRGRTSAAGPTARGRTSAAGPTALSPFARLRENNKNSSAAVGGTGATSAGKNTSDPSASVTSDIKGPQRPQPQQYNVVQQHNFNMAGAPVAPPGGMLMGGPNAMPVGGPASTTTMGNYSTSGAATGALNSTSSSSGSTTMGSSSHAARPPLPTPIMANPQLYHHHHQPGKGGQPPAGKPMMQQVGFSKDGRPLFAPVPVPVYNGTTPADKMIGKGNKKPALVPQLPPIVPFLGPDRTGQPMTAIIEESESSRSRNTATATSTMVPTNSRSRGGDENDPNSGLSSANSSMDFAKVGASPYGRDGDDEDDQSLSLNGHQDPMDAYEEQMEAFNAYYQALEDFGREENLENPSGFLSSETEEEYEEADEDFSREAEQGRPGAPPGSS
ncbi:unnamed protein product [Amoebophrya sp. A120]|nr:unnamed protein product [Amoebophrya sp. A120]|eukprot:GSA120T00013943001.1